MDVVANQVLLCLKPLIGLKLSLARRSMDMRNFHFGQLRRVEGSVVGEFALHLYCPWRLAGPEGLITGRLDVWEPLKETLDFDWNSWDYDRGGNLQDWYLSQLLGSYDPKVDALVNQSDDFIVETVQTDNCGGAVLHLSGGYQLSIFPAGRVGEDWRILRPGIDEPHFVISGGRVLT